MEFAAHLNVVEDDVSATLAVMVMTGSNIVPLSAVSFVVVAVVAAALGAVI